MTHYQLPAITAQDPQGQLRQLRSYLYRLVEELNLSQDTPQAQTKTVSPTREKSPGEIFSGIKSLIIQSADIVDAYYEEMERKFSGSYVAQGEFGTYRESTRQQITEHASAIERNFQNVQQVETTMAGIERILVGVNAYINSGLLYYAEGTPVYGIEVGQRTQENGEEIFRKYARFTSSQLSFYDANDNQVACISDWQLSITNAQISGALRRGHLVDYVQSDGSIVTKYAAQG